MEWRCFGSAVQLQSPRGIMGVNLPHTVLLQARESIIISQSRWRSFSTVFPSLFCRATLLESGLIQWECMGATAVLDKEWWNPHEIRWKLYSTHIRRLSDSSFICEVMIVELCLRTECVHTVRVCSFVLGAGKYHASYSRLWLMMKADNDIRLND